MLVNPTEKKQLNMGILALLAGLIIARLSCIALTNIPLMTIGFIMLYAIAFIVLLVFSMSFLAEREIYAALALLAYAFEVVISCLIADKGLFETQAYNVYIVVILFFLYLYMKRLPAKRQKLFSFIALAGYLFTFVYSIIKLAEDPMLSRIAATGRYDSESVDTLSAIGGFDTVYGGLLVFVVLAYLLAHVKSRKLKIFFLLSLICCVLFIVMATYATAIVLLVAAVALIIFKRSKVSACLLMLVLLACLIFRENIGNGIMEWSKTIEYSEVFQEKMYQIGYIIRYGESVGTLAGDEGRWARIGWSLETFWQYPFFGGFTVEGARLGYHSEIADMLGRFGLFGFAAITIFFVTIFKDVWKGMKTSMGKKMLFVSVVIYLAIAVLDPALYTQQVLPIFLLIPFAESFMSPRED